MCVSCVLHTTRLNPFYRSSTARRPSVKEPLCRKKHDGIPRHYPQNSTTGQQPPQGDGEGAVMRPQGSRFSQEQPLASLCELVTALSPIPSPHPHIHTQTHTHTQATHLGRCRAPPVLEPSLAAVSSGDRQIYSYFIYPIGKFSCHCSNKWENTIQRQGGVRRSGR